MLLSSEDGPSLSTSSGSRLLPCTDTNRQDCGTSDEKTASIGSPSQSIPSASLQATQTSISPLMVASECERVIHNAERVMLQALENEDEERLLQEFFSLHRLLGPDIVLRALSLAEAWEVRVVREEMNTMPYIYEVQPRRRKGQEIPHFYIYPDVNFCKCKRFTEKVLMEQSQFTCEHVLGLRLARILSRVGEDRVVDREEMENVLKNITTPDIWPEADNQRNE